MKLRQINSTIYPMTFLLIQSGNHILGATGVSPSVSISKNGGAFAAPAGSVSEIGKGWYSLAGNATDRNTLGPFLINATGVGIDQFDDYYEIVGYDPFGASVSVSGGTINTITNIVNATGLVSIHPNDLNSIVTGVWKEKFNTVNYNPYGSHTAMSGLSVIFNSTSGLNYTGSYLNAQIKGIDNQLIIGPTLAASAVTTIASGILLDTNRKLYTYHNGAVSGVTDPISNVTISPLNINTIISGVWTQRFNDSNYDVYGSHTTMSGIRNIFDRTSGLLYTGRNVNAYVKGLDNQILVSQSFADSAANFIASGVLSNPSNKIYTDIGGGVVLAPSGLKYINPVIPTGVFLSDFDQKILMIFRSLYNHREMVKLATGSGVIYTRDSNMNIIGVQSFTDDSTSQIQGDVH